MAGIRIPEPVLAYRFIVGQIVKMRRGFHAMTFPDTHYSVVKLLPPNVAGAPQYLLRNETDSHVRVVAEPQIECRIERAITSH